MDTLIYYNVTITQSYKNGKCYNYIFDNDYNTLDKAKQFIYSLLDGLCYNDKPNTTITLNMIIDYQGIYTNNKQFIELEKIQTQYI